jgi:integrase
VEALSVFPGMHAAQLGTLLGDANVRHIFERILENAKLRRIRFYDLRHTFASLLIQQGESLAYVKEQMGHSSIQITVVYGHLVAGGTVQLSIGWMTCNQLQPRRNQTRKSQ